MERKRLITLALCALGTLCTHAQKDDFGIWSEVNVEKKLSKKWSLDGGVEMRTRDNTGTIDRWSFGVGANYKLTDWLKLSVGYNLLDDNRHKVNDSGKKIAKYWSLRHRFNLSATLSHSFGNLTVSLRERYQFTYRPERTVKRYWNYTDEDEDRYEGEYADDHTFSGKSKHVWRNRLQLKYKITKVWRPYVNVETHVSSGLEKIRYAAGTEIRLDKHHSLDVKYLYQNIRNTDDDEGNSHILGLGYTYSF